MAERPDDRRAAPALLARAVAARARRRLELARARARPAARARLHRRAARPAARDLLGRRAHARIAGPCPRRATRTCCCWTSPRTTSTSTSLEWLEEYLTETRLGRDPRGARPLVPGGGRHLRARARGRALALLPGLVARMAARGGGARDPARQADREAAGGDRAHGALHRALPLQGDQGAPGPVAREEARQDGADRARSHRQPLARLQVRRRRARRAGRARPGGRPARGAGPDAARRRRAVARARRARVARRARTAPARRR